MNAWHEDNPFWHVKVTSFFGTTFLFPKFYHSIEALPLLSIFSSILSKFIPSCSSNNALSLFGFFIIFAPDCGSVSNKSKKLMKLVIFGISPWNYLVPQGRVSITIGALFILK
jgi:hypothetical protein